MHVSYNDKSDLLYIRLDDRRQDVINRRVSDDVVLDIGDLERRHLTSSNVLTIPRLELLAFSYELRAIALPPFHPSSIPLFQYSLFSPGFWLLATDSSLLNPQSAIPNPQS